MSVNPGIRTAVGNIGCQRTESVQRGNVRILLKTRRPVLLVAAEVY